MSFLRHTGRHLRARLYREGRDHWEHPDPAVRELIQRAKADERERVLAPIVALRDQWRREDRLVPDLLLSAAIKQARSAS